MSAKRKLPIRKELEEMREQKEEIDREVEKEWKKDQVEEGYEEKKRVLSYRHNILHRTHIKECPVKKVHLGHVKGKLTHIRRNRRGRMAEKK